MDDHHDSIGSSEITADKDETCRFVCLRIDLNIACTTSVNTRRSTYRDWHTSQLASTLEQIENGLIEQSTDGFVSLLILVRVGKDVELERFIRLDRHELVILTNNGQHEIQRSNDPLLLKWYPYPSSVSLDGRWTLSAGFESTSIFLSKRAQGMQTATSSDRPHTLFAVRVLIVRRFSRTTNAVD